MEVNHADGLMTATTYGDATPAVSLAYDVFQRLSAASNAVATYAYANSALGAATNETATVGGKVHTLTRELDNRHRLASLGIGADQVHYVYDEENRIAAVSNAAFAAEYAYTPDGYDAGYAIRLTNGVILSRALTRDPYRRSLITAFTNAIDGVPLNSLAYTYDLLNRPAARNADTFGYNGRSEVTFALVQPAHTNRYEYDNIGNNRWTTLNDVETTFTANALNQYTAISNLVQSCNPVHDLDGNMLTNGAWSYTWDAKNRLTGVASNGIPVVTNAYDYMNRRVTKTTAAKVTDFIWDGWNIVAEIAVDRQTGETNLTRYVWGLDLSGTLQGAGGVGGLLAVSLNGTWHFPLFDNNGNITAYVNEQSTVVAEYTYDAFGRTIVQSGPMADAFHHRFSTKYFDAKTGLYYYGYRFYLPELMRWLNRDPIEESSGVNLYTYIDNDSVNAADYVGLLKIWYDSTGKEICRTQKWWPFVVTKYIKGPNGNVNFNGNSYWQVWHHDNGYLPGTHSGINENWDVPMLQFVNSQKGLSFTAPSWYLPAMPGWIKSYDLVMANSPAGAAWDYKQFLASDQWYVYKGKAFRFDSIGNITWGAIMKRYNWPRPVALIGAGLYQIKTDFDNKILTPWGLIYRLLQGTSGDDPRDQEAINEGYYF